MTPIEDPTREMELMEENLHAHVAYVQRHLPSMHVLDHDELLLVDSGLPTDTFNKIARVRLSAASAEQKIRVAIQCFKDAGRPFTAWVGPCSRPLDLEARLQRCGLMESESEVGMIAAPAALTPAIRHVALVVRRVKTPEQLNDFAAVNAANWDPPDTNVIEFFRRAAPLLLADNCPMRLFVGYAEGQAVASSELFMSKDVAGIHMVSTRREFQRRAYGLAMTWTAADEGRRMGARLISLQASDQGLPVYERLGFVPLCRFVEYQLPS